MKPGHSIPPACSAGRLKPAAFAGCLCWLPLPAASAGCLCWLPLLAASAGCLCWLLVLAACAGYSQRSTPTLAPSGSLVPARMRPERIQDWHHSFTVGQLRFVNVVALIEAAAMVLAITIIYGDLGIAQWACGRTCLCWWLNPRWKHFGSWYDFGAGLAFNSLVNSFIGDTLFSSFVARLLGLALARRAARNLPTQRLMDEACRSREPNYLPWRIVHMVKAWYFAFILM